MTTEVVVVTEADRAEASEIVGHDWYGGHVSWIETGGQTQYVSDGMVRIAERIARIRTEAERAGEQRERARIVAWLRAVPYQRENCADMIEVATHESRTIGAGR